MDFTLSADDFVGGSYALGAAAVWAVASIFWRRLGDRVAPVGMNLAKGLVGLVCILAVFSFTPFTVPSLRSWLLLGASGIIGIGVGDTVYFGALIRLGPRRALLMTALIPVATTLAAMVFLGEMLTPSDAVGAVLCVGGVTWVMFERLPEDTLAHVKRGGIALAMLFIVCEAAGYLLSKLGLEGVKPMDALFVRMLFGVAYLVIIGSARRQVADWLRPFWHLRSLTVLVVASFIGTFLGMWFALEALHYTSTSRAAILSSTSPIFILPLVALLMHEKVTRRAVLGAVIAVAGVGLLMAS
ncbi:MAG: DMT family transporter [Deltaproteobacteria bacterium]|nr:DMT family transporter [Deltaproteobacteria bacterium]MCB9487815.1 DMT family transporter [Deltaproteobacteria bacterium]